jgi:hypothetical protein
MGHNLSANNTGHWVILRIQDALFFTLEYDSGTLINYNPARAMYHKLLQWNYQLKGVAFS